MAVGLKRDVSGEGKRGGVERREELFKVAMTCPLHTPSFAHSKRPGPLLPGPAPLVGEELHPEAD